MGIDLLVIETHPVQYRAPIYRAINRLRPNKIHVIYASDYSLRGTRDPEFSQGVQWDDSLLEGYNSTILDSTRTTVPLGWTSLFSFRLPGLILQKRPKAILLTSLNFIYDYTAYITALTAGIQVWIRCETQDDAYERTFFKDLFRSLYYTLVYSGITKAFYIGELNREHWLRHGLKLEQLNPAYYCTDDRIQVLTRLVKQGRRSVLRKKLGIKPHDICISFFGKLISKKDPELLLRAVRYLDTTFQKRVVLLYVGNGILLHKLRERYDSLDAKYNIRLICAGFLSQQEIIDYYLATDITVLPSRRAGETWGLVINEALQAGSSVITTKNVGCSADFGHLERFRIINTGCAQSLAKAVMELSDFEHDFEWATTYLSNYTIHAVARSIVAEIDLLTY